MKKLLIASALLLTLGFSACKHSGSSTANMEGFDSLFTQAQADSLVGAMGTAMGFQNREQFDRVSKQDSTLSKEAFMKGLRYIMNADTATAFTYGMYTAFNMNAQIKQMETQGIKVDRTVLYNNFQKVFMADSVSEMQGALAQEEAGRLSRQLREAQQAYELAKVKNSPESKENIARGRQAIDSVGNAGYKVLASGVAYKIDEAGKGTDSIKTTSRIKMAYTGRTLNGRVFDKSQGDNVRPVLVSTRVPGMQDAITKMHVGDKATIYIPGAEAYQENLNGRYGLGPNEAVVYEVEILELVN
ncbi:MAG: FKBP-type peptidyl-prolyl cis-trans isomerase [Bacteroidales bacterium]|nr:FKBP-type peptidyl-prolyl cis-trans isomerase [Bacteroidales bacterium]